MLWKDMEVSFEKNFSRNLAEKRNLMKMENECL